MFKHRLSRSVLEASLEASLELSFVLLCLKSGNSYLQFHITIK